MFRPAGQDRQAIGFAGEGKGKGVVVDIAVDDRRQGTADGLRRVVPPVRCGNVRLHQRSVALLRLRLQPGREAPGPRGRAYEPDRLTFAQGALPDQRQVKTARNQPAGTARRTEVGRNPVQAEPARTDELIGRFPRPDTDISAAHFPSGPDLPPRIRPVRQRRPGSDDPSTVPMELRRMTLTRPEASCRLTPPASVGRFYTNRDGIVNA